MYVPLRRKTWVLAIAIGALVGCRGANGHGLTLSERKVDLGTIRTEDTAETKLTLTNQGPKAVAIGGVDFGCGCTVADYPKQLASGASATISIVYKPELFWSGTRTEKGTIRTSDSTQPTLEFTVIAHLQPPIEIRPSTPQIVAFIPGKAKAAQIDFTPRADRAATFHFGIKSPLPGLLVNKKTAAGIQLNAPARTLTPGDHAFQFVIDSTQGDIPYMLIFQASQGPVSNPSTIDLKLREDQTMTKVRELHLYSRKGRIAITSIRATEPELSVKFEPTGTSYRAAVMYGKGWKQGQHHQGTIRVHLKDRAYPLLEIPYSITVG